LDHAASHVSSELSNDHRQVVTPATIAPDAKPGDPSPICAEDTEADNDPPAEPLLMAHAGEGPLGGVTPKIVVFPPRNCFTIGEFSSFPLRFQRVETASFTTEFDVTAETDNGGIIGISPQPTADYNQMPLIIWFGYHGYMLAWNGDHWDATRYIPYTPGVQYHFVVDVNVQTQTYTVRVNAPGSTQLYLAGLFAFRSYPTPIVIASLDYWDLWTWGSASLKACNFKLD
jgi:hypothetical protein